MFKGFQDTSRSQQFKGFPNLNFQMNNEAYGFSGCTFWLNAAYGLNTQTDLDAITYWKDRIRNISFEQATAANQPRYNSSNANFNNYPAVEFQSNTRYLLSSIGIQTSASFAVAFVAKCNVANAANPNVLLGITSGGNGSIALRKTSVNGIGWYNGGTNLMDSGVIDTNTHICVLTNNLIIIDGVVTTSGSVIPLISFIQIGNLNTGYALQGTVAEIIVFNNLLSDSDCIKLSDNINSKYAIY